MKSVECWNDLRPFGIEPLTGEACGLMYRILFDLTAKGRKIVEKALGMTLSAEPWNRGSAEDPHVASIMLSEEMRVPIGIFALLESGYRLVWLLDDKSLIGFQAGDKPEDAWLGERKAVRQLRYAGTAGDRNQHVFSGRVE